MKVNWGTSIIIAFALFMSFILFFVFKVQTDTKYDNDLVVEEYYKHDIHFSDEMIRVQNEQNLVKKATIIETNEGIKITFPNFFLPEKIKGKVSLYRPSNKKLDFEISISLSDSTLLIPKTKLVGGRWDINMEWQYNGKSYLSKTKLNLKL
jgi:hypothetical protein